MSVQKRTRNGQVRWVARYRGPDKKERSKTFETKKAAQAWAAEREREMRRAEWVAPEMGQITVAELVERWRDLAKRDSTRGIRSFLLGNLGQLRDTPIAQLTTRQLREWVAELLSGRPWVENATLDPVTVRNLGAQLSGALSLAVEDGHVHHVPKIPLPKNPSHRITRGELLTPEQIWQLADTVRLGYRRHRASHQFARIILVAAGTGLRAGELCGLRISSVDFLRREITVTEQAGGACPWGWLPLKTAASRRVIPIGQEVVQVLAEELATNPSGDRSAPLFRTSRGGMWSPSTIANVFVRLRRQLELPEGVSFHDLRHFYASTLIFAGASVPMVAQFLGHASAAVTLDVYAHLWPGDFDRARDAVDGALVRDRCGTDGDCTNPVPSLVPTRNRT
ncbi:tyrosine-type recombinase/integrase [Rhodococcus jostii]|uniref:tyrosine-type recombinase/integrase n=1 Tax=Rhodococcus jostii TaxID=132919 RepID=UPI003637BA4D